MDLIGETPAGKTFYAFWRLLTDIEQSTIFSESLTEVVTRDFASQLGGGEKRFLRNLTSRLLDEGGNVHEVLQTFSRSLRTFVQSREYLEQRRFNTVLRESQRDALAIKERLRPNQDVGLPNGLGDVAERAYAVLQGRFGADSFTPSIWTCWWTLSKSGASTSSNALRVSTSLAMVKAISMPPFEK